MNLLKLFIVLSIFFNLSFNVYGQCGIVSPKAENISCEENATYKFDLNFIISDAGLDSFDVFTNNIFIKRYSADQLPVTVINNIYSGLDEDTIKIADVNTGCFESIIVENPCSCIFFDTKYSKINCDDDSFFLILDFKHIKHSDSFEIGSAVKYFGEFAYSDLPVQIGSFLNFDTTYSLFLVDIDDIFCYSEFQVNAGDCPQCEISNLDKLSYYCDDDYNKNISFTFDHSNSGTKGYDVFVNGFKYVTNSYLNSTIIDSIFLREQFELNSIDIECDSILDIKIVDVENPDCFTQESFSSFCCELCEISALDIRDKECTSDSTFSFILDFSYEKNRKDSFSLVIEGELFDKYSLSDLPLHIIDYKISEDNVYEVSVCLDNGKCCSNTEIEAPDCKYFDCSITGALYSITYDSISNYWITFNELVHQNTSDSFSIRGNGKKYGTFSYSDLPIQLEPYLCADSLVLEYLFKDTKVDNCEYVIEPGIVNCPFKVATNDVDLYGNWDIYSDANYLYIVSKSSVFSHASIKIFSVVGQKVFESNLGNNAHFFKKDISKLISGIYIVQFKTDNKTFAKKIYINN